MASSERDSERKRYIREYFPPPPLTPAIIGESDERLHDKEKSWDAISSEVRRDEGVQKMVRSWIIFCKSALAGYNLRDEEFVPYFKTENLNQWRYASIALIEERGVDIEIEDRKKIIEGAARAFRTLLGEKVEMEPQDPEEAIKLVRAIFNLELSGGYGVYLAVTKP